MKTIAPKKSADKQGIHKSTVRSDKRQTLSATSRLNGGTSSVQSAIVCACDGGCPLCLPIIQPKLVTGQPNDKFEQEANRAGEEKGSMPEPGLDFNHVRIHHGMGNISRPAIAAAKGSDIYLSPQLNQLPSLLQKAILAHEFVHVLQRERAQQTSVPGWDVSRLEAEAGQASLAAIRGRTFGVQGIDRDNQPRFHPIFISTHGSQGFLDNARQFYIRWGYGTPTSVSSIEEIVTQLAEGAGHLDRMTIVSHAVPNNINISFLRGGPGFVNQSEWAITTRQALPGYGGHATEVRMVNQVINDVRSSSQNNAELLQRLSLDFTEPEERQFVWWLIDVDFVRRVQPANAIPNRNRVRLRAQQNAHHYREGIREQLQYFAQLGLDVQPNDIDNLEQAINAVLSSYNWNPINHQTGRAIRDQILSGREASVQRVLDQQFGQGVTEPFSLALMFAQMRFDAGSTIEVKGCRIGQNHSYLEGISRFFGGGERNPTVTAPDMFQIFGSMGSHPHPDQTNHLRGLWNNASIRQAFIYWAGVFGWSLSEPPVADDMVNVFRAGYAFPVGTVLHYLTGHDPGNIAGWFARFGYPLAQAPDIEQAFFANRATLAGIQYTLIDWLQDARIGQNPGQFIFPPDPEYLNHIISVQAAAAQVLP